MLEILESVPAVSSGITVRWPAALDNDDNFDELCRLNSDLRIERTAGGNLFFMPPTYSRTGNRNFNLVGQVYAWSATNGTGVGFDSSTGFTLPNGAKRSPDASWARKTRLAALKEEEKEKFLPLCPDVVFELRSATDTLEDLLDKMREYIANGAQLGFLLDPKTRRGYIFHSGGAEEILERPETMSGEPVMPGFTLSLRNIWNADF